MKYNNAMRSHLLQIIIKLKTHYMNEISINQDVEYEVHTYRKEFGPDAMPLRCQAVDRTLMEMAEMTRDLCILLRNIQKINHYLITADKNNLDKEIDSHFTERAKHVDKWDVTARKRMGVCDIMLAIGSPEDGENDL